MRDWELAATSAPPLGHISLGLFWNHSGTIIPPPPSTITQSNSLHSILCLEEEREGEAGWLLGVLILIYILAYLETRLDLTCSSSFWTGRRASAHTHPKWRRMMKMKGQQQQQNNAKPKELLWHDQCSRKGEELSKDASYKTVLAQELNSKTTNFFSGAI